MQSEVIGSLLRQRREELGFPLGEAAATAGRRNDFAHEGTCCRADQGGLQIMRCIFCKKDSRSSRSREHIVPESLGNEAHMLPPGVVCDKCNNYFARKLEQPLLASPIFTLLRAERRIKNKRGRVPDLPASSGCWLPPSRLMGRFLGKVGLEVLASRLLEVDGWNDEIVDKVELDDLRNFVRHNLGPSEWPFSHRTLYPVNAIFEEGGQHFEVLHEYTLLATDTREVYVVIAVLGVEFVLNLGGPTVDGFERWLSEHKGASPLYFSDADEQRDATSQATFDSRAIPAPTQLHGSTAPSVPGLKNTSLCDLANEPEVRNRAPRNRRE